MSNEIEDCTPYVMPVHEAGSYYAVQYAWNTVGYWETVGISLSVWDTLEEAITDARELAQTIGSRYEPYDWKTIEAIELATNRR